MAELEEYISASVGVVKLLGQNAPEDAFQSFMKGSVECSSFASFKASSDRHYQQQINRLLELLITTSKKPEVEHISKKRITTRVKDIFERSRLLGGKNDIGNHLIVPNYEIDNRQGLVADFALQNSVMHVTQTIEFNSTDAKSKRQQSALNALTLEQAVKIFGPGTARYIVYSITNNSMDENIEKSLFMLKGYADHMVNLGSKSDVDDYIDIIRTAASPDPTNYGLQ
jgi:hypothetical protein